MRMRRLRRSDSMRALVRETTLEPGDLIYPLFICPGEHVRREVGSMPGVFNLSVDETVHEAEEAASLGIGGLLLFGLPESKDEQGTGAWSEAGIVQQALRALRQSSAAKNQLSTARSAKPPIQPRSSATARLTRWMELTSAKPCAKSSLTSRKART